LIKKPFFNQYKNRKVLSVHEDKVFGGFGGELAELSAKKPFEWLDAPVRG
jgi:2-oxoisovalerate dehydrogenase E1 component